MPKMKQNALSCLKLLVLMMVLYLGQSCWGSDDVAGCMQPKGMTLRLHNLTAFGQKTWAYLEEMEGAEKPDVIAVVESHLLGGSS